MNNLFRTFLEHLKDENHNKSIKIELFHINHDLLNVHQQLFHNLQ